MVEIFYGMMNNYMINSKMHILTNIIKSEFAEFNLVLFNFNYNIIVFELSSFSLTLRLDEFENITYKLKEILPASIDYQYYNSRTIRIHVHI